MVTSHRLVDLAVGLLFAAAAVAQSPVLLPGTPMDPLANEFRFRDTTAVVAFDFDGDNRTDLFCANRGELPTQLLHNDGGWAFTAKPWPPNLHYPRLTAAAADLDGDGDQDLVAIRNTSHPVYVELLLNTPTGFVDGTIGRFPTAPTSTYFPFATTVALGDIDGDGDVDLVVGHGNAGQNRLYRNNGSGVFTDGTQPGLPYFNGNTVDLELLDVDGDQDLDLVTGLTGQPSRLALNDGTGVFLDATATHFAGINVAVTSIASGDVDGDGDRDLVFGEAPGTTRLFVNDGTGHFSAAALPSWGGQHVALLDADGDQDLDLFLGVRGFQPQLFTNDGSGAFTNATAVSLPSLQPIQTAVVVADFDADGRQDVVLGCEIQPWAVDPNTRTMRLRGQGLGLVEVTDTIAEPWGGMVPIASLYTNSLLLLDHDQDGDLDLIVGNDQQTQDRLYQNDGHGVFTDVTGTRMPADTTNTVEMAAGDLDGDGIQDLVLTNYNGQSRLYRGQLGGGFVDATSGRMPAATMLAISVALGDLDSDGDLDIVIGTDGQTRTYRNNGSGFFTDQTQFWMPPQSAITTSIAIADVDGDGDRDIVTLDKIGGPQNGVVRLYRNNGTGTMTWVNPTPMLGNNYDHGALAVADFDNDGDLDICAGPVFANNGNGTSFVLVSGSTGGTGNDAQFVLSDLDGDAVLDLVSVSMRQWDLWGGDWYRLNNGTGVLTGVRFTSRADQSRGVAVGDVDGDGDPDVLVGNKPSSYFLGLPRPGQIRLYANATRHVTVIGTPRIGSQVQVRAYARAANLVSPLLTATFASAGVAAAPIALPPFGNVLVDPLTVIPFDAGFTDPQLGYYAGGIAIPSVPALVGAALYFQALVENRALGGQPQLRLSNATRLVVLP